MVARVHVAALFCVCAWGCDEASVRLALGEPMPRIDATQPKFPLAEVRRHIDQEVEIVAKLNGYLGGTLYPDVYVDELVSGFDDFESAHHGKPALLRGRIRVGDDSRFLGGQQGRSGPGQYLYLDLMSYQLVDETPTSAR